MIHRLRIAVVGGGITGLAASLGLARDGHDVSLFERLAEPGAAGAGLLLQPVGLLALDRLGLRKQMESSGARILRLQGLNARGRNVLDLQYRDFDPSLYGVGIHRGVLFSGLLAAVRDSPVRLQLGVAIEGVEQRADVAELSGRNSPRSAPMRYGPFDLVVASDGLRSALRDQCGLAANVRPYPWGAFWAIAERPPALARDVLAQRYRRAFEMVGLLPTGIGPGGRDEVSLFWSVRASEQQSFAKGDFAAWRSRVLALMPEAEFVLAQLGSFDDLVYASYADVTMPCWHRENVVIMGDAAHATSPQLGMGANMGLVDAVVLRECVARASESGRSAASIARTALLEWQMKRQPALRYFQWASRMLTPLFQSDSLLAGWPRDAALGAMRHVPWAHREVLATLAGFKRRVWPSAKVEFKY